MELDAKKDWSKRIIELRRELNLSQEDLAAQLQTCQSTISRWERGITNPNYRMREKLADVGRKLELEEKPGLGAARDIAQSLIDNSITNSILLHPDGTVMAASFDTEYSQGSTLIEQTLPEELDEFKAFEAFLEKVSFWNSPNACFEYFYRSRNEDRCAILTSLQIGSQIYCLAQKKLNA